MNHRASVGPLFAALACVVFLIEALIAEPERFHYYPLTDVEKAELAGARRGLRDTIQHIGLNHGVYPAVGPCDPENGLRKVRELDADADSLIVWVTYEPCR